MKEIVPMVVIFEVGETYSMTSVGDHNCVWKYKVVKRTTKTITLEGIDGADGGGTKRPSIWDNAESVNPLGSYSMAPILRATNKEGE